jgi:hypothetical protein
MKKAILLLVTLSLGAVFSSAHAASVSPLTSLNLYDSASPDIMSWNMIGGAVVPSNYNVASFTMEGGDRVRVSNLFTTGSTEVTFSLYDSSMALIDTAALGVGDAIDLGMSLVAGTYILIASSLGLSDGSYIATVSAVPLPGAAILFGSSLLGFGIFRRKKGQMVPRAA